MRRMGNFAFNMFVTCKVSGGVWAVDGAGTVTNVGSFVTASEQIGPQH